MKSMMSDAKALRYARLLRQYCAERGCKRNECKFAQENDICILQAAKNPECWQLDDLREDNADG